MQLFNLALCWLFFGFLAAHLARKRQKNPKVWFWVGLMLGLFGVLLLYLLPRRMQTHKVVASPTPSQPAPPLPLLPAEPVWYYYDAKKERHGPIALCQMRQLAEKGELNEQTFVWTQEMTGWLRIKDLPSELKKWFDSYTVSSFEKNAPRIGRGVE